MSRLRRHRPLPAALASACVLGLLAVGDASAALGDTGGAAFIPPPPPPKKATIVNGRATVPLGAPRRVQHVIRAANRLVGKAYRYGGGHRAFSSLDSGYDCSGSVSYALYGGRFLNAPLPSSGLMSWGRAGTGRWITVYAHGGHAYIVVAGLRFDTSLHDLDAPRPLSGPRWSKRLRASAAFVPRHPGGY